MWNPLFSVYKQFNLARDFVGSRERRKERDSIIPSIPSPEENEFITDLDRSRKPLRGELCQRRNDSRLGSSRLSASHGVIAGTRLYDSAGNYVPRCARTDSEIDFPEHGCIGASRGEDSP